MTVKKKNSQELFDLFQKHFEEEKQKKEALAEKGKSRGHSQEPSKGTPKIKPRKIIKASTSTPAPPPPISPSKQPKEEADQVRPPASSTVPQPQQVPPPPTPQPIPAADTTIQPPPPSRPAHASPYRSLEEDPQPREITITMNHNTILLAVIMMLIISMGFFFAGIKVGKGRGGGPQDPEMAQLLQTIPRVDDKQIGFKPQPPHTLPPAPAQAKTTNVRPVTPSIHAADAGGTWSLVLQSARNNNHTRMQFEKLIDKLKSQPGIPSTDFLLEPTSDKKFLMLTVGRFQSDKDMELQKLRQWFKKFRIKGYSFTDCRIRELK